MNPNTANTGMAPMYLAAQQACQIADRMTPPQRLLDEIMRKIEKRANEGCHSLYLSEKDAHCPIDFVTAEGKRAWAEAKESLMAAGYQVSETKHVFTVVTVTWPSDGSPRIPMTHRENTTMLDPMTKLRRLLSDRGIAYDAVSDIMTYVYLPDRSIGYFSIPGGPSQHIHVRMTPLMADGASLTWMPARHITWLTPEQAVMASIDGKEPEEDPRNYVPVPDGDRLPCECEAYRPKIPNITIGADPDWVDWVASLRHDNPTDVREAVEHVAFEAICFGADMGPNGNTWCGVDEGQVWTDGVIDSWVKMVERLARTDGQVER